MKPLLGTQISTARQHHRTIWQLVQWPFIEGHYIWYST